MYVYLHFKFGIQFVLFEPQYNTKCLYGTCYLQTVIHTPLRVMYPNVKWIEQRIFLSTSQFPTSGLIFLLND